MEFDRALADLRDQVLTGQMPKPTRIVTLDEYVGPWFEKLDRRDRARGGSRR